MLKVENLKIAFNIEDYVFPAVFGVDFEIQKGETFGLVGESGCGKSITSASVIKLLPSSAIIQDGKIEFKGQNLLELDEDGMQKIRGAKIAFIPQDPLNSLNPLYSVGEQIVETILAHKDISKDEAKKLAIKVLKDVKIPDAQKRFDEYPHQFSGGMCQRVIIAMALCTEPEFIIADEPTTALDVTVQAQILDLIKELQEKNNMSMLLITHDLGVVAQNADNVAVMYFGRIVETANTETLFNNPMHPYTKALLASLPDMTKERLENIEGQPPAITDEITGCPFHLRCPHKMDICIEKEPLLKAKSAVQKVACWLYK